MKKPQIKNDPKLSLYEGAGNSFWITSNLDLEWNGLSLTDRRELARWCCHRLNPTIDGLIFVEAQRETSNGAPSLWWDFYNNDGSSAEMCGNAARCVTDFLRLRDQNKSVFTILTGAGSVTGTWFSQDRIEIQMPTLKILEENKTLVVDGQKIQGDWLNTGVPHFVVREKIEANICAKIRKHKDLGASGSNVTLISDEQASSCSAVTFERGVEDFTPACGTGAVAAAMSIALKNPQLNFDTNWISVKMPGGKLEVLLQRSLELKTINPILRGEVIKLEEKKLSDFFRGET